MALFSKVSPKTKDISNKINSATIVTSCMTVTGDFNGSDTIHIDGKVMGNIVVSNTLIIGTSGVVEGNVEAKNVIINGELKGSVNCENLEVMQTGKVSKYIQAKHLISDGNIEGEINAEESIQVLSNSTIQAISLKSKIITVNGLVKGTVIATELLDIQSKGFVEGTITVKKIKTEEGGRVIGTMSTYEESIKKEEINKNPKIA